MSLASTAALRQFTFFDVEPVKDIHDPNSSPEIFKNAPEVSAMTSTTHGLVVADIHGSVHLLNQTFVSTSSWIAHVGGRVTHMVERKGILITIGEEDTVRSSILKIWDLGKFDKRTGGPSLLRTAKVQPTGKPHPVSALSITSTLSYLAIGLADGTVLLYRHLDQSLSSASGSVPKPKIVHDIPTEPVTFLGFTSVGPSSSMDAFSAPDFNATSSSSANAAPTANTNTPPNLTLLITTTSSTYAYPLLPKPSSPVSVLVDEIGAGLRCACVDWKERWVILGTDEAVVGIGSGGRVGVFSFEEPKQSVYTHMNYVVMVLPLATSPSTSPPSQTATTATPAARQRKFTADSSTISTVLSSKSGNNMSSGRADIDAARVVLVDMGNKLVAYSGAFEQGIRDVVSEWGYVFILGNDGKLTRLTEKPTPNKLSLLYAKHLYPLALSVAHTQNLDPTDVHLHHGDYLYEKGDYEGAMKEYLRTIGGVRGSYVVRKFLTTHLTPLLTLYLQELHAHGLANAEHTTLLLNTYAKVGDIAKVDAFVRSEGRVGGVGASPGVGAPGEGTSREPPFDLDTAIRVCRQAGFFDHAAYLAKRWGRHEDYLRVVVEDVGDGNDSGKGEKEGVEKEEKGKITNGYKAAVAYLREVGGAAAESNLARYCRALLDNLPNETTQLLIDLCTIVGPLPSSSTSPGNTQPQVQTGAAPSYLSYLALSRASAVPPALSGGDGAVKERDTEDGGVEEDLAVALAAGPGGQSSIPQTPSASAAQQLQTHHLQGTQTPPKRPSPTLFFAHFVDHPGCFTEFLETVAKRRWGQTLDVIPSAEPGAVAVGAEDEEAEKRDQVAVWNTLLELYLTEGTDALHVDKGTEHGNHQGQITTNNDKALRLLRASHIPYDLTHALMLCSSYEHTHGLVLLWERMGMYEDVLRFWMDKYNSAVGDPDPTAPELSPSAQVVSALRQYGPTHPYLYPLVLRFLTSSPALLSAHQSDLEELLEHVESEKIMSPLAVVQLLSRNGVASVGLVKEWLMRRISEGREEVATDQQLINSYRHETKTKLKQVEDLEDTEHPRVFHVTRCSQCNGQLDLPSVHFMCSHSYHQRCLLENDTACPLCTRQHGVIQEIRRNNERLADQHELFLAEVKENGFKAVAGGFGRGWLGVARREEVIA
ncbi:hypothetical protein HYDPIDRAFT_114138 [Hydnomerulius pinastri MD-312]|uniref:RING-type domain-containing protein n=1 Tax=Hydnomerulius pinastri MD-312 TaxID=994086 RepID=A0A0C9W766_9AGAM|nr:hypothetical protein HYDPIDRAFT_114138 [Hydnomerulius pinastri MD-312]